MLRISLLVTHFLCLSRIPKRHEQTAWEGNLVTYSSRVAAYSYEDFQLIFFLKTSNASWMLNVVKRLNLLHWCITIFSDPVVFNREQCLSYSLCKLACIDLVFLQYIIIIFWLQDYNTGNKLESNWDMIHNSVEKNSSGFCRNILSFPFRDNKS